MNWGKKILLVYVAFVALVLVMVFLSMKQKVDLDAPDYYDQELAYQQKIDASKNHAEAGSGWNIKEEGNTVVVSFSDSSLAAAISGSVLFFRGSDSDHDVKKQIKLNQNGQQLIPLSAFVKGAYIVKIDWKIGEKNFFEQQNIFLN